MVDLDYLAKLLVILKGQGVVSFDNRELHINFEKQAFQPILTQDHHVDLPINEAELPPDLRTDNINNFDAMLNWSTEPTSEEIPIPGVGDEQGA